MNKEKRRTNTKSDRLSYIILTVLVVVLVALVTICGIVITKMNEIDNHINTNVENENLKEPTYYTIDDVYENPDIVGTYQLVCGYFCKEFAEDTGIDWIAGEKEKSKDEVDRLIRLERDEPIDYTPKAIAVYGKLEIIDEALVIKDGQFYLYGGTDKEMLKHNALIELGIIDTVMVALRYEDTTDIGAELAILQSTACDYEDEDLEKLLIDIQLLAEQKETLSQTDFETKAEQLWDNFRTQLLDR